MADAWTPIRVPGQAFWGDTDRVKLLGDPEGKQVFETRKSVEVGGSFQAEDKSHWLIYLGKYEVTRAQYALVMGDGNLNAGIHYLAERSTNGPELIRRLIEERNKNKRINALAKPVNGLTYFDYLSFIQRLNDNCSKETACRKALPRFEACFERGPALTECRNKPGNTGRVSGFFRLSTEAEWEFTARGGMDAPGNIPFEAVLPFPTGQVDKYAWVGKSQTYRVGRKAPTLGVYDLFGNVSELAQDLFHSGLQSGKPGAYTARGGSFFDSKKTLRSSLRTEVSLYQWDPSTETLTPSQSQSVGIRLAVGSPTIATPDMRELVGTDYRAYHQRAVQGATALLMPASGTRSRDPLIRIEDLAQALMTIQPEVAKRLKTNVTEVREILGREVQRASRKTAGLCWAASVELAEAIFRARRAVDRAERVSTELIRVQQQLPKLHKSAGDWQDKVSLSFRKYVEQVEDLVRFDKAYVLTAVSELESQTTKLLYERVYDLLRKHVNNALAGRVDVEDWRQGFNHVFADDAIFQQP